MSAMYRCDVCGVAMGQGEPSGRVEAYSSEGRVLDEESYKDVCRSCLERIRETCRGIAANVPR